jgi:hypothetical protein
MRQRFVLLGLARARADWFRTVGHWATAAILQAEFVRCVSMEELRARLRSGRAFSAVLIDGGVPGCDRDLIADAAAADVTVLVVDDGTARRDWLELGAAAVLAPAFSRDELMEVLAATSEPVGSGTVDGPATHPSEDAGGAGELIAVTGPGGTGASTIAIALAQGLAAGDGRESARRSARSEPLRPASTVLLADLCLAADQAVLHDSRVVVPGLQEVVEAHRAATPTLTSLREQTFDVPERGYRLLLGLRRRRHWVAVRPRALDATLDQLQKLADLVVVDVEADVEGEAETGSLDVEERNLLARASLARAGVVVVVGEPSMKGVFALVRTIGDLIAFGVPPDRLVTIVNQAPRSPRARAEIGGAVVDLLTGLTGSAAERMVAPIHLPRREVDRALRDGVAIPAPLPATLARAVVAVIGRAQEREPVPAGAPRLVVPGSLSGFTSQERPSP